ncbi:hypothetical protein R1sor_009363 [Riccia sorocarpa]|uniref:Inner centromere protein ARK-binding domain-containing protein n=1 Tax=Riccia sorocarpa TaxID=122646 RepID=A0ABD3HXL9_9MARC
MEKTWLEVMVDSIEDHRNHVKLLLEQERALFKLEAKRLLEQHRPPVATTEAVVAELPAATGEVPAEPPVEEGKGASKRGYVAEGTENNVAPPGSPIMQSNSNKRVRYSTRQRKPLMDVTNLERASSSFQAAKRREDAGLEGTLGNTPKDCRDHRDSAGTLPSDVAKLSASLQTTSGEKSTGRPPEVSPGRRKNRKGNTSKAEITNSARGIASLDVLPDADRSERGSAKLEVSCPVPVSAPLRITRSRAKNLKTGVGHLVAEGDQSPKKPRGKKNVKTNLEPHDPEGDGPSKKPRAQKGRNKAPLPSQEDGQDEEFIGIDPSVRLTGKSDGGKIFVDSSHGKSKAAGDSKYESVIELSDSLDNGTRPHRDPKYGSVILLSDSLDTGTIPDRDPSARRKGGRKQKAVSKSGKSAEVNQTSAAVSLELRSKTRSGCKVVERNQSFSEDGPRKQRTASPDGSKSRAEHEQEQERGDVASARKEIDIAVSQQLQEHRVTPAIDTPASFVRRESREGDGARQSEESEVLSGRLMEIDEPQLISASSRPQGLKVGLSPGHEVHDNKLTASVSHMDVNKPVVAGLCPVVKVSPVVHSPLSYKDEQISDQVVNAGWCIEAGDSRYVTPRVGGINHQDKGKAVLQQDFNNNSQEFRPVVGTDAETKGVEESRKHEVSAEGVSKIPSFEKRGVHNILGDVQPAKDGISPLLCHENDADLRSADFDSQRWNIIKSSVKVRKGRGKAVSSFLGYADSDLFPPRSLALGCDESFDLAPYQESKDVENAEKPDEGLGSIRLPSHCLQVTGETDCIERGTGKDGSTVDKEEERNSRFLTRGNGLSDDFRVSEGDTDNAVEARVRVAPVEGPSGFSVREKVDGNSGVSVDLQERMDTTCGTPFLTPRSTNGELTPILTSGGRTVSRREFPNEMKELDEEMNSIELRKLTSEIVVELCIDDKARDAEDMMREKPCPLQGLITGRSHTSPSFVGERSNHEVLAATCSQTHTPRIAVDNSKVRSAREDQGGQIPSKQDEELADTRSRKRPLAEFVAAKVNSDKKISSLYKSWKQVEHHHFDEERVISDADTKRKMETRRNVPSDTSKDVLDATHVVHLSCKRLISNQTFTPINSAMRFTDSGNPNLLSQGRNVSEDSAGQQRDQEASPFHFPQAKKIRRSDRVVEGVSHCQVRKSSRLSKQQKGGVSLFQFHPPTASKIGAGASGGVVGLESRKDAISSGVRRTLDVEKRHSSKSDSLPTCGKVVSQAGAGAGILTQGQRVGKPLVSASTAVTPPCNQDRLSGTELLGSSRESDKCEISPCKTEKQSVSLKLTFKEQRTPRMSLVYGSQTRKSNLELLKDVETSSREQTLQHRKDLTRRLSTQMKSCEGTRHAPLMSPCGSSRSGRDHEKVKSPLRTPVCAGMEARLSQAEGSGRNAEWAYVHARLADEKSVQPIAVNLHQSELDLVSGSTISLREKDEDEDPGAEDSGNTSILSRSTTELGTEEVKQRRDTEVLSVNSVENNFDGQEDALDEDGASTDVQDSSDDEDVDTEEVGQLNMALEQEDNHAGEGEAQSPSRAVSYKAEADSSYGQKSLRKSTVNRTKAAGTLAVDAGKPSSNSVRDCEYPTSVEEVARSGEGPKVVSIIINPFLRSTAVRTLIPVMQRPAPNYIPNGKRDVKVKALEAAEAARRLQEKRELEKRERMQKMAQRIVKRGMEKEQAKEETQKAEQEAKMASKAVPNVVSVRELSSNTARTVLAECTNTKPLSSPKAKLTRGLAQKIKMEHKKKEAELLARKRKKEEADKAEQERLRAELEEKEHRNRMREEAEHKRKALEEEARRQRRAEREKERERRLKEDQEAKAAKQAEKEVERKRKEEQDHRMAGSTDAGNRPSKLRKGFSTDKSRASNRAPSGASLGQASSLNGIKSLSFSTENMKKGFAGNNPEPNSSVPKVLATPSAVLKEPEESGPQTYEISPYRPSSDEEDETSKPQRSKKPVPTWARTANLMIQLERQLTQDPDEIFAGVKTCSLQEVFGTKGSMKVLDFSRRSGSGDWVKDHISLQEELEYKIRMGYLKPAH